MSGEHAIAAIESKDDAAIIAEITGSGVALAKDYVYSFKQGGKKVTGLTIAVSMRQQTAEVELRLQN